MKPKSLLVIGGTGFFGKSILKYLLNDNFLNIKINKVFILSRKTSKLVTCNKKVKKKIKIIKINSDILTVKKLPIADYVIYAAILKNFSKDHKAVRKYLKLAKNYHFKSKILYISSGAVYGKQSPSIIDFKENFIKSNNKISFNKGYKKEYSKIKLKNEELFKNFGKKGGKVSIARCFSFVGEYLPRNSYYVVGNIIKNILNNETINIRSNYKIIRSYMYSDDLVRWLFKILFRSDKSCPIYNVGSNNAVKIHELALLLAKKYNLSVKSKVINKKGIDKYIPNVDKAKRELGLKNNYNSFQAIIKTINLLKKNEAS
jgi:dTDP-glucose 4,6-dehydratase